MTIDERAGAIVTLAIFLTGVACGVMGTTLLLVISRWIGNL